VADVPPLPVSVVRGGRATEVTAVGEIDMDTADVLKKCLASARNGRRTVVLDLSGVGFFGSAGVNCLLAEITSGADLRVVASHMVSKLNSESNVDSCRVWSFHVRELNP
jgi:anti-sigma B factor antagonist